MNIIDMSNNFSCPSFLPNSCHLFENMNMNLNKNKINKNNIEKKMLRHKRNYPKLNNNFTLIQKENSFCIIDI